MSGEAGADEGEQRWSWGQVLLHPIASYDDLVETLQSSSDATYKEIGYATAVALNVILLLTKFAMPQSWRLAFGVALLGVSVAFALRFFTRKRKYQIFQRAGSQPFRSPNLRTTIKSPRKASAGSDYNGNDITGVSELYQWDPPVLSQIVFCYFSPLQVIVLLAANDSDTTASIYALIFSVMIALSITFMCRMYTTWKNDQDIIFKQVYDEQTRFMLSQTARPKADAAIQADAVDTHEPSYLYQPFPPSVVVVSPAKPAAQTPRGGFVSRSSASVQATPQPPLASPASVVKKKKPRKSNPFQQDS
jgi:hypothetical protein